MHEVLHIIGLCPDSFAHIDLIDVIVANYENITYINPIQILKKQKYVIKRRFSRFFAQYKR